MLSRLHISSYIGLIITVWLVALWWQGEQVLTEDFIKPFGIVVGIIVLFVALFNKYIWSWRIIKGWYIKRPDLRGTWKVELKSSWIDPKTNKKKPTIVAYAVIRQTLTSLSLRLLTLESKSVLIAHNINEQEVPDLFKLIGVYRNEPKIDLQSNQSEIHYGSFILDIHEDPALEMDGHYWTDRETNGEMKFTTKKSELCTTYEKATKLFSEAKNTL